jgi:queuine tRNA-ribosyltransferase
MIFEVEKTSSKSLARAGTLTLPNGVVQTPIFMPIGTAGTVKGLTVADLEMVNAQIILGNTYHLWLRPGMEVIGKAGGLHNFGGWSRPILTDSGGFQAFSLSKIRKFTEDGVTFRSQLNGDMLFLSPEVSMGIQTVIGSDISLVLDECLPAEVTHLTAKKAMHRTRRWAERSKIEWERLRQDTGHQNLLFGIPQGAQFNDLRVESARMTMELDFPGYSIGGVANGGEPEEIMYTQVQTQTEILEPHKPRHLLGVGTPKDIVQMVARGIDMFDCVYPTRNARHGNVFFEAGDDAYLSERIAKEQYKFDFSPINIHSRIPELRLYSKSYLRHLFVAKELLAYRLATLNNLEFYLNLTTKIRTKILDGTFDSWWEGYHRVV